MIQFLNAASGTASTTEMLLSFLPMILILVFMVVLIYLPQKRQDKKDAAMRNSIEIGDKVTTIGGIVGIESRPQGCEKNQRGGGEWQDGERLLHDGTLEQWQQPLHPLQ